MAKKNGWVKLHRKILATPLSSSQFKFFVGTILLAKTLKSPNPGLVDYTIRELSNELHMSRSEVWRREKELEKMEMLTLLEKGFIINNYKYYQTGIGVPPTGQEKETSVPPTGQSVPPTGQSVPPTGQSVPSRESKSGNKKDKNNKNNKKKFDIFWGAYPKRKSKGYAEKVFAKVNPDEQLLATMLAKIEQAKKSEDWQREDGKFIPYPATWLNSKGWEDEFRGQADHKSKFDDGWK